LGIQPDARQKARSLL